MQILHLHLKRKWWEQIRDGEKTTELRRASAYWRGIARERVLHEEFGPVPVDVYVIDVGSKHEKHSQPQPR